MFELLPLLLVFGRILWYEDGGLTPKDLVSILYGIPFGILIRLIYRGGNKIADYFLLYFPALLMILSATRIVENQGFYNGIGIFISFILTTIFLDKIKDIKKKIAKEFEQLCKFSSQIDAISIEDLHASNLKLAGPSIEVLLGFFLSSYAI